MQDMNLQEAVAHPLVKYRNHIEFSGYKIEEEYDDWLFGKHPRKANLGLKKIGERGVLVSTVYAIKEEISRMDILEFINDLNTEFLFLKAYITEDRMMRLETFFEGEYDRTNFSILLENFDYDMNIFYGKELTHAYVQ